MGFLDSGGVGVIDGDVVVGQRLHFTTVFSEKGDGCDAVGFCMIEGFDEIFGVSRGGNG